MTLKYFSPLDQFKPGILYRSIDTVWFFDNTEINLNFINIIFQSFFENFIFSRFLFAILIAEFFLFLIADFFFAPAAKYIPNTKYKFVQPLITVLPSNGLIILEELYKMTFEMVMSNINDKKNYIFFPIIFFNFIFVAFLNISGLIPFGYTVTASLVVTFLIAFMAFISLNVISIEKNKLNYFNLFFPPGVPAALVPLLTLIEFISYYFRVISLSVRLFANMMAGHTLFYVLMSFILSGLKINQVTIYDSLFNKFYMFFIYSFKIILCFSIMLALFALETAVALIQAYVFTILITIYINDALHPSH